MAEAEAGVRYYGVHDHERRADPETVATQSQRQRAVVRGLGTLARKERAALVLREVEGLSTREVAEILGSSEVTVRTQICSARLKLKKFTDRFLGTKL